MREFFGEQGSCHMPDYIQYVVDGWPVRFIVLDTNIPGDDAGTLCPERLGWLEERLAEEPERPTMILLHHPPFLSGVPVLDETRLDGIEALGDIIARHPNVERITAGHIHCAMQKSFHGVLAMTCPSTAHQMLWDLVPSERLGTVLQPPAILLHVWSDTAGLLTRTSMIGDHGPRVEMHDGRKWL